jgi:hypothetical protein
VLNLDPLPAASSAAGEAAMLRFEKGAGRCLANLAMKAEDPHMTETAQESQTPSPAWQMSACLEILDDIQEQIRFADSKAGFIAAFNVLLFGFVANHVDKLRTLCGGRELGAGCVALALVLVGVYVTSMVITFGLVVSCVISRFGSRAPQGRVFFAHIAAKYGKDHPRYTREMSAMTNAEWLEELGAQVVEVSRLAILKHKQVRWAAYCTLLSVLLWVGSLATLISTCWVKAA